MNDSQISSDDPRLTAYALGELEGEEQARVEAAVAADPALQSAVDEIRATAGRLTAALEAEPLPEPAPAPHTALYHTVRPARIFRFPYWAAAGLAAAACVAVLFTLREMPVAKKAAAKKDVALAEAHTAAKAAVAAPAASADGLIDIQFPPKGAPNETIGTVVPKPPSPAANQAGPAAADLPALASFPPEPVKNDESIQLQAFDVESRASGASRSQPAGGGAAVLGAAVRQDVAVAIPEPREMPERLRRPNAPGGPPFNTEAYDYVADNDFLGATQNPLSTFSVDVDTASYSNVRRFLQGGQRPPRDAVRIEELVNYFSYAYPAPKPADPDPFAASLEVASAPWAPTHRLVRIGLKGRELSTADRPAANLVFLLDVSGSMDEPNKLPLVKESLRMLVGKLKAEDRVAIVIYAGASGLALPSTPASHQQEILEAIDRLEAGGSTNGAMGIQLAYDIAKANFRPGGINRVILATDGDFNVGVTDQGDLVRLIEEKAKGGVFLTALGFGMGNYKDSTLEKLADKGNGAYAYIDSAREARKVLVEQVNGTLATIAKDVKVQVEFNPAKVQAYRLIGYENRLLKKEDFNNDKIDAGDIGAGHTVTALYEVIPVGVEWKPESSVDPLKYQRSGFTVPGSGSAKSNSEPGTLNPELLTVKLRYKAPNGDTSKLLEFPLTDAGGSFAAASTDFKFAAAVAGFGLVLRDSPHKGTATLGDVVHWAEEGTGSDAGGYRGEFISLVKQAETILPSQG